MIHSIKKLRLHHVLFILGVPAFLTVAGALLSGTPLHAAFIPALGAVFFGIFFSFMANNYFDHALDTKNPAKTHRTGKKEALLLAAGALGAGIAIMAVWLPPLLFWYALATLNSLAYSMMFKRVPALDVLSHGLSIVLAFLITGIAAGLSGTMLLTGSWFSFHISTMIELENELDDYRFDKRARRRTTAVFFGKERTAMLYHATSLLLFISIAAAAAFFSRSELLVFLLVPLYRSARMMKK